MLADKYHDRIQKIFAKYPDKRSAIMGLLYLAQEEYGWVTPDAVDEIAHLIDTDRTQVDSIAGFYTMYRESPKGKYWLQVCTDLPCALRGADEMMEHIEHRLGCKAGQTSADGKVTLREAECLGGCDHAPVMLVDGVEHQQDLTNEKIDEILERLKK